MSQELYFRLKLFNYVVGRDIFENSSLIFWGVLKGDIESLSVQITPRRPAGLDYGAGS